MFNAQFTDFIEYDREFMLDDVVQVVVKSRDPKIKGVYVGIINKINRKSIEVRITLNHEKGHYFLVRIPNSKEILPYHMFLEEV